MPPPDEDPRVTPEELLAWLKRHRISRAELARRLPASRSSVTKWCKDSRPGGRPAPRWLARALRDLAVEIKAERAARRQQKKKGNPDG